MTADAKASSAVLPEEKQLEGVASVEFGLGKGKNNEVKRRMTGDDEETNSEA